MLRDESVRKQPIFSEKKVGSILYSQLPRSAKLGVNNVSKLTLLDMCFARNEQQTYIKFAQGMQARNSPQSRLNIRTMGRHLWTYIGY